jgi:hypothetical protein
MAKCAFRGFSALGVQEVARSGREIRRCGPKVGSVSSRWGAIYGGRLLPDQIGEMTKGKLPYRFGRSLLCNDKAQLNLTLPLAALGVHFTFTESDARLVSVWSSMKLRSL